MPDVVLLVDVESDVAVAAAAAAADSVDDVSPDVSPDVDLVELVEDDSDEVPVVSALAKPGEVTTITPIPRAAANAPTRPT